MNVLCEEVIIFLKLVSLSCLNVLVVGVLCPEGREVEKEGKASLWRAAS